MKDSDYYLFMGFSLGLGIATIIFSIIIEVIYK